MANYIYRIRKGVPGVGRRLAKALNLIELTSKKPLEKIQLPAIVINYGRSVNPEWMQNGIIGLNAPDAVALAVDKIKTLNTLHEMGHEYCLPFTTEKEVALKWLEEDGSVVVRKTVKGKKGNGLIIATTEDEVVDAPLYTRHFKKTHEFRVHIFLSEVIDYVQKKKMSKAKLEAMGIEQVNMDVRNHMRGWVFARKDIIDSVFIKQIAVDAVDMLDLDFAAVDVLARVEHGKVVGAVVCEVNSAPGMSDKNTFNAYTKAMKGFIDFIDNTHGD